jgi:hypothetical protein
MKFSLVFLFWVWLLGFVLWWVMPLHGASFELLSKNLEYPLVKNRIRKDARAFLRQTSLCGCLRGTWLAHPDLSTDVLSLLITHLKRKLRVYVYPIDVQGYWEKTKFAYYQNSNNAFVVENIFTKLLLKSRYRTLNPNNATDYFIPIRLVEAIKSAPVGVTRHAVGAYTTAQVVSHIQTNFPYFNQTQSAHHFWVSVYDGGKDFAAWAGEHFNIHASALVANADVKDSHRIIRPELEPIISPHFKQLQLIEEKKRLQSQRAQLNRMNEMNENFDLNHTQPNSNSLITSILSHNLNSNSNSSLNSNSNSNSSSSSTSSSLDPNPNTPQDTYQSFPHITQSIDSFFSEKEILIKRTYPYRYNPLVDVSLPCNAHRGRYELALKFVEAVESNLRPNFAFFSGE